jgi:predicted kinase
MDLERLGRADDAERLVTAYRDHGGDTGSPPLLALFCAYRACVRALVAALRGDQLRDEARAEARSEADALIRLAWRYVWRPHLPVVLVICGPSAVGKTTLATELADLTGLPHLSSDRSRKALAGLRPEQRAAPEVYSDAWTERVYRDLGREARKSRQGAIVDATFRRRADRVTFLRALAPVTPVFVECIAPRNLVAARARAREQEPLRDSDAGVALALAQLDAFEPLAQSGICVDTAAPVALVAAAIEARLAAGSAGTTDDATEKDRETHIDGLPSDPHLLRRL